ncbi:hypothetical protein KI387_018583, partial [Taxus chinensis]
KKEDVRFWEAECLEIDSKHKKIRCHANIDISKEKDDFSLDYDYLIITVGARSNTFNTPGVVEHCHFLKEVEDAQRIRGSIVDCFERASLPHLNNEEREKTLHFVIVGGGPTGVEFAAELHDFVYEDLLKLYPSMKDFVKITVIQSGDHILNMFDMRISNFAEEKFQRDGIEVQTGSRVVEVTDKHINIKEKGSGEASSISYGMIVWSTGIGTRPVISQFMEQIGQADRRVLATDEWLRVKGCDNVFALGDCATIDQRKILEDISYIFKVADKDNSGFLTAEEFLDVIKDIRMRYPQIDLYLERQHMNNVTKLLEGAVKNRHGKTLELDIEEFTSALSHVDSQMKTLPATAQKYESFSEGFKANMPFTEYCKMKIGSRPKRDHTMQIPELQRRLGHFSIPHFDESKKCTTQSWIQKLKTYFDLNPMREKDAVKHFKELTHLRQTGSLDVYIADFQRLSIRFPNVSEMRLTSLFIVELIDARAGLMKAFEPSSLHDAIRRARDLELSTPKSRFPPRVQLRVPPFRPDGF